MTLREYIDQCEVHSDYSTSNIYTVSHTNQLTYRLFQAHIFRQLFDLIIRRHQLPDKNFQSFFHRFLRRVFVDVDVKVL